MSGETSYRVKHRASHQQLIKSVLKRRGRVLGPLSPEYRFDAIVVPTSRPPLFLNHAVDLALESDSWLVILCSGSSKPLDVRKLLEHRLAGKVAIAEVPRTYGHSIIEFSSLPISSFRTDNLYRESDLSAKRNLGLVLSLMLGWQRVFFLDDDIRNVTVGDLHHVASLLEECNCVGFSMDFFPDNSVVSHAKRLGFGNHQEIMISGAAMGVRCSSDMSFFPSIYNEDLFFMLDGISRGTVLHAGSLGQLPYEPFDRPERAASEEFGEVLMEGLLALLHEGLDDTHATHDYWLEFLLARMRHIESIKDGLRLGRSPCHEAALLAMQAAQDRLSEISPALCTLYLANWQADLEEWRKRLRSLTAQPSMSRALSYLNLTDALVIEDQGPSRTGSRMRPTAEQTNIRKISAADWKLLKQVRLQALQDSPRAFASSYDKEEAFTEQQWQSILQHDLQWFMAFDNSEPIATVAARSGPGIAPDERYVESMWVNPRYRRTGVARRLIAALEETVRSEGAQVLLLWVLDGNEIARNSYLKLGFTSTGDRQRLEKYPNRIEERMSRPIPRG